MVSHLLVLLFLEFQLSLDSRIEMILDVIVSSSWQELSNLCPPVTMVSMSLHDDFILPFGPFPSFDIWVKMVVPSLPALLAYSSRKVLRDETPIFGSVFSDHFADFLVLLRSPRPFN